MRKISGLVRAARLTALLGVVLVFANCTLPRFTHPETTLHDVLDSYREQVSEVIEDPERAAKLVELGEDQSLRLQTDMEKLRGMVEELGLKNARYDTTREELASLVAAINQHRGRMREEMLAARMTAVSLTTPEEWRALMVRREKLMDLLRATPGLF